MLTGGGNGKFKVLTVSEDKLGDSSNHLSRQSEATMSESSVKFVFVERLAVESMHPLELDTRPLLWPLLTAQFAILAIDYMFQISNCHLLLFLVRLAKVITACSNLGSSGLL